MAGDSKAKVIPLHGDPNRAGSRASQRATASRRHPSALPKPPTGTAEEIDCRMTSIDLLYEVGEVIG
jgi:hypothetical protein